MAIERTYIASEWPHGLRCIECNRRFVEDELVCSRKIYDDVKEILCAACDYVEGELEDA